MKIKHILLSILLTLIIGIISAQPSDNLREGLIGNWEGTGSLFGMEASFSMHWSNELNDKFIKLNFENRFSDNEGNERKMNAQAYYNLKKKNGFWFDSRGLILPLRLDIEGEKMTVFWGEAATEQGKTIYSITSDQKIHVEDFVLRDGEFAPFGLADYVKKQ